MIPLIPYNLLGTTKNLALWAWQEQGRKGTKGTEGIEGTEEKVLPVPLVLPVPYFVPKSECSSL